MKIYIPSRARYDPKYFTAKLSPIHWLTTDRLKGQAAYVVRDSEHRDYVHALRPFGIDVIPCGAPDNLSQTRQWIAEYAASRGEKSFIMSDDDINLQIRKSPETINLRQPEPDEIDNLIFDVIPRLLEDYAQVGISARQGNNYTGGVKPYTGPSPILRECKRATGIFAVRTDDYLSIDANRLSEMADFDTTLQFLRKGLKNVVLFYWVYNHRGSQLPGGCALYRTLETHERVAQQLKDYHPEFVLLVEKQYGERQHKFGKEFDTRTEVRVRWQKAYKSSQKRVA